MNNINCDKKIFFLEINFKFLFLIFFLEINFKFLFLIFEFKFFFYKYCS
jgi:hypothetical protein